MRGVIVSVLALALAGCGGGAVDMAVSDNGIPEVGDCNAASHRGLIGQSADDRPALSVLAPKVRFIEPGEAVTQDQQPQRLNLELDDQGVITRVYCG